MRGVMAQLDAIRYVDTPLKLLALFVVTFAITVGVVVPAAAQVVQLASIVTMGIVVLVALAVVYSRGSWSDPVGEPLLGDEHLPLDPERVHILRSGKWRCTWTARDVNGDLKGYTKDTITIRKVDPATGVIEGSGTNVYDDGNDYDVRGRVSRKGFAHLYYSSQGRHEEKSGMVILKFDFQTETAEGWWLGGLRGEGIPVSGRVTWTEDANVDGWDDEPIEFEYYPTGGPVDDRTDDVSRAATS